MKETIYRLLPNFLQNALVSLFNLMAYRKRYGGKYNNYLKLFKANSSLSLEKLEFLQEQKFKELVSFSVKNSQFYNKLYSKNQKPITLKSISSLPILNKEDLRKQIDSVYTLQKNEGIISKTGGTTGKSLEVVFTTCNMQERFAMLDYFRNTFGYKLGEKTAWFSGKNLISKKDINRNRFWKTDYYYKVRYYSTFHIKTDYLKYYIQNLIKYKPAYFVGFPSTMLEIANYGLTNSLTFPKGIVKAIFPTAETVTPIMRETIELYFNSNIYDQYASSEGAPFIMECKNKNLHLELQSGVFEVLDDEDQPTTKGRLVCTSFTSYGTPLIRYDIGDFIELSSKSCNCGNNNPLVESIAGRIDDFVYSEENGKINLGNISNTLKDTSGIVKFQVEQNELSSLIIHVVIDVDTYSKSVENKFISNWRDRVGYKTNLKLNYVNEIAVAKSGKYQMVINNIKHLLD